MLDRENVIDGRTRFQQQTATGRLASSFEERLARTARVSTGDRPIMATNLGRLAARINPDNPLAGAKSMVEGTGHEGLWQKRKRFIRLPAEPADASKVTGSSGVTYLQLARSAGQLLATSELPDAVERERERSIRAMLVGTTFLPTYTPLSTSDRTAKDLLDEYGLVLLNAVKSRTRITDLWAVLRDSPIDLEARFADDGPFEFPLGGVEKFPEALLRPIFNDKVVEAIFRPKEGMGFDWEEPTLELGFIAVQFATRLFAISKDIAKLFHASREDDDGQLCSDGIAWMREIDAGNGWSLPDDAFDESVGYGWKSATFSLLRKVGLNIEKGEDGNPKLRLNMWGGGFAENYPVAYSQYGTNGHLENQIVESRGKTSQMRLVDVNLDEAAYVYAVYSNPVGDKVGEEAEVVGLLPEWWAYKSDFHGVSETGWSDDPTGASLLLNGKHRFIPTIEDCEPVAGPLRAGSLGAALLNNALKAPSNRRVSNLLIEKAALTADAGLRFHEALVDHYREALRRI